MTHDLKCWNEPFEAMLNGRKTFEWRRDDRGYSVGDTLMLREWHPEANAYSGRAVSVKVTYLLRGAFNIPPGYVVMSVMRLP